jgi:hypothetical protein
MFEVFVDILNNFTLASCAFQIKYTFAYKDFNINPDYNTSTNTIQLRYDFNYKKKRILKKILEQLILKKILKKKI